MIYIQNLRDGAEIFQALDSEVRIRILELLLEHCCLSMNELAAHLNITNGALTAHIKKLENCGLVTVTTGGNSHGNQKLCTVCTDKLLVEFSSPSRKNGEAYSAEIHVGQFCDYQVLPTCGIASAQNLIGAVDDIRYFDSPDRYNADIIWFTNGYVEYAIPNLTPADASITRLSVSMELGSEAPGVSANWPSEIAFSINGIDVGSWLSPADMGDTRGIFTPLWWPTNWNQYGFLKLLTVSEEGTYMDGLLVSNVSISDLGLTPQSSIRLRMSVKETKSRFGGLTIFGKNFGNYNQNIVADVQYRQSET